MPASDAAFRAEEDYELRQSGLVRLMPCMTAGAFFATLSRAAVPTTLGFISKWFGFQPLFQGFSLDKAQCSDCFGVVGREAGAVRCNRFGHLRKVIGLGLLGRVEESEPRAHKFGLNVVCPDLSLLVLAIGMP